MLALVKKAEEAFDKDEMQRAQEQLEKGQFTLDDFRRQLNQIKKLGSLGKIMDLIPGMGEFKKMMDGMNPDGDMKRLGGIIDSMTQAERRNPSKVIDQSRRRRIAAGAGVEPHEVNELVKQFEGMADMMKKLSGMGMRDRMRAVSEISQGGLMNPGARFAKPKQGTGKRLTSEEKNKMRKQREKELRKKKRDGK
jgi:signal recognition particle subunit SRP54